MTANEEVFSHDWAFASLLATQEPVEVLPLVVSEVWYEADDELDVIFYREDEPILNDIIKVYDSDTVFLQLDHSIDATLDYVETFYELVDESTVRISVHKDFDIDSEISLTCNVDE